MVSSVVSNGDAVRVCVSATILQVTSGIGDKLSHLLSAIEWSPEELAATTGSCGVVVDRSIGSDVIW